MSLKKNLRVIKKNLRISEKSINFKNIEIQQKVGILLRKCVIEVIGDFETGRFSTV